MDLGSAQSTEATVDPQIDLVNEPEDTRVGTGVEPGDAGIDDDFGIEM